MMSKEELGQASSALLRWFSSQRIGGEDGLVIMWQVIGGVLHQTLGHLAAKERDAEIRRFYAAAAEDTVRAMHVGNVVDLRDRR